MTTADKSGVKYAIDQATDALLKAAEELAEELGVTQPYRLLVVPVGSMTDFDKPIRRKVVLVQRKGSKLIQLVILRETLRVEAGLDGWNLKQDITIEEENP